MKGKIMCFEKTIRGLKNKKICIVFSEIVAPGALKFLAFLEQDNSVTWVSVHSGEEIPCVNDKKIIHKGNMIEADIIIMIYPLLEDFTEDIYRKLYKIENSSLQVILLDWPREDLLGKLYPKVEAIYRKAIFASPDIIMERNHKYFKQINGAKELFITTDDGSNICFKIEKNKVAFENCNVQTERILQLPGGEIFFPICDVVGNIIIEGKSYPIENSVINYQTSFWGGYSTFCEFGLGTNPCMPYLSFLDIQEKAWKTCHFGFGNNISFGGHIDLPYHFDITFPKFTLYADGRIVEI